MPGALGSHPSTPEPAPLFVRDRYGSADSNSTLDELEPEPAKDPGETNPWSDEQPEVNEKAVAPEPDRRIPPADTGLKAWSVLAGASLIEGFLWGKLHAIYLVRLC